MFGGGGDGHDFEWKRIMDIVCSLLKLGEIIHRRAEADRERPITSRRRRSLMPLAASWGPLSGVLACLAPQLSLQPALGLSWALQLRLSVLIFTSSRASSVSVWLAEVISFSLLL